MEDRDLRAHLDNLRTGHRDLDLAIEALRVSRDPDELRLARLKKRKLRLRDEIVRAEALLIPDILA